MKLEKHFNILSIHNSQFESMQDYHSDFSFFARYRVQSIGKNAIMLKIN